MSLVGYFILKPYRGTSKMARFTDAESLLVVDRGSGQGKIGIKLQVCQMNKF
jgi:hypothetical protein